MKTKIVGVLAIGIMFVMIMSALMIITPQSAKASPTTLFYDDFERTGNLSMPQWPNVNVKDTFSTEQHYAGAKSLKISVPAYSGSASCYRWFVNNTPTTNKGFILESMFYDGSLTDTSTMTALYLGNIGGITIDFGIRDAYSSTNYSYWWVDSGLPQQGIVTDIQRQSGWHNLRIISSGYQNFVFQYDYSTVGKIKLIDEALLEYFGFVILDDGAANHYVYLDDFTLSSIGITALPIYREPTNPISNPTPPAFIIEQSVFKVGNTYEMWYRANDNLDDDGYIGYAASTNGLHWTNSSYNPILTDKQWVFPFVMQNGNNFYLFVNKVSNGNIYLFNLTLNHTSPIPMNSGLPVLVHNTDIEAYDNVLFNVGVAYANGILHMVFDAKTHDGFPHTGYAQSTFSELNFTNHRSISPIIYKTGCADLKYIPEANALLFVGGFQFITTNNKWVIRAAYVNLSDNPFLITSWNLIPALKFSIENSAYHIADSSLTIDGNTVRIYYGTNQSQISLAYFNGTMLDLFNNLTGQNITPIPTPIPSKTQSEIAIILMIAVAIIAIGLLWIKFAGRTLSDFIYLMASMIIVSILIPIASLLLGV